MSAAMQVDQFKSQALHLASTLVAASRCLFYDVGQDLEPTGHIVMGDDTRFISAYVTQFRACDPFHPRYFAAMQRSVFRTGEGGGTQLDRDRYIGSFMRPMGIAYKAEMFLRDEGGIIVAGMRMSRKAGLGEFRDADVNALEAMQPVMERALRAARASDRLGRVHSQMTVREREVLRYMLDGAPNKVIAKKLALALPTVKSHVKSILQKVGATSRADAISQIFRLS